MTHLPETLQSSIYILESLNFKVNPLKSKKKIERKKHIAEYERVQRMTWFEFLSNVGGLCGLCLGFSLVSAIEIVYWFAFRLSRTLCQKV